MLGGLAAALLGLMLLAFAIEASLTQGKPTRLGDSWEPRYVVESPGR